MESLLKLSKSTELARSIVAETVQQIPDSRILPVDLPILMLGLLILRPSVAVATQIVLLYNEDEIQTVRWNFADGTRKG